MIISNNGKAFGPLGLIQLQALWAGKSYRHLFQPMTETANTIEKGLPPLNLPFCPPNDKD
jgi:hypothetical protein